MRPGESALKSLCVNKPGRRNTSKGEKGQNKEGTGIKTGFQSTYYFLPSLLSNRNTLQPSASARGLSSYKTFTKELLITHSLLAVSVVVYLPPFSFFYPVSWRNESVLAWVSEGADAGVQETPAGPGLFFKVELRSYFDLFSNPHDT